MAARKEILDFIMLERKETPPTHEDVQAHALRIIDIYNERRADLLTLQNDLFELVASCKLYERMGLKYRTSDFETAIMILIMTATDWELYLPDSEVQRYENVKLNVIENLAVFIRDTYSHHHGQHNPPEQTPIGNRHEAIDEEKQSADTSTPSAEIMEDATDLTPATADNEKQEKGKAGKKSAKDFREYFLPGIDADLLLPILHEFLDGKIGKELAKYIVVITNVWITEPGHKSVCKEFKASESAYKEAIDKHYCRNQYSGVRKDKIGKPFPENELAAIRNNIKKRIEEINGDTSTP